jgi:hypothetical protein
VGFLAPRLAPREWSEGQSLARIASTSVVRANSASVVGVVVSGVRGSAESKRPLAERDVPFDEDLDNEVGHAHALHGATGLVERGLDALHRLAERRGDDRGRLVAREVPGAVDADPVIPAPAAVEEPACGLGGGVGRRHQGPSVARWDRQEDMARLRDHVCGEEEVLHEDPGAPRDDRRERGLEVDHRNVPHDDTRSSRAQSTLTLTLK